MKPSNVDGKGREIYRGFIVWPYGGTDQSSALLGHFCAGLHPTGPRLHLLSDLTLCDHTGYGSPVCAWVQSAEECRQLIDRFWDKVQKIDLSTQTLRDNLMKG